MVSCTGGSGDDNTIMQYPGDLLAYLVSLGGVECLKDSPENHRVKFPPGDGKSPQNSEDESDEMII